MQVMKNATELHSVGEEELHQLFLITLPSQDRATELVYKLPLNV